jgi:Flp pilus assembly protein CpaB
MSRVLVALRELRRAASWHRRLLAAGLAAAAMGMGLHVVSPDPPPTTRVLAAAHDLAGGHRLRAGDLREVGLPTELVPAGALAPGDAAVGRLLAAPLRSGQPLCDVQLIGRSLLAGYGTDVVGAPVRIGDAGSVALLDVGESVDVLASDPRGGDASATLLASAVPVVAIPDVATDGGPLGGGALVVLAVSAELASRLAQASVAEQLSLVLRG